MATKRSYDDACASAHGLDLIGERWALLIVRELLLGPKRFTDLRNDLPRISPNVLTQRLGELEQASIVRRRKLAPPAAAWVYELTDWGLELEPVIMSIGRWGARSPGLPQGAALSVDALILSLRTMFEPNAASDFKASIELKIGEHIFHAQLAEGRLELARGKKARPDAIIEADADTLAALVYGGRTFTEALRAGDVTVKGDKSAVKRFLTLFPLPKPARASSSQA